MRTVSPEELLEKFKEIAGEEALEEFERHNEESAPLPDNVEGIKLTWLEFFVPDILRITEANGCRQQGSITDFFNETWEVMEDLYETYDDITIFDAKAPKPEEFEADAEPRFEAVKDRYDKDKKCNFLHGTLTCYCD